MDGFQEDLEFEAVNNAAEEGEALILDIDGYEGPLHLLLELARKQKVDLAKLSILELAEQYIAFIKSAQDLRIELAADYLVMASWLAYLKSKLILPKDNETDEPLEAEEMAAHFAFRLERLAAMRSAAEGLFRLPKTGDAVFKRGMPEGLRSRTSPLYEAEIFDLLKAYGTSRSREAIKNHKLPKPKVLSLEEARDRLRRALKNAHSNLDEWTALEGLLPKTSDMAEDVPQASIKASSLLAGLELAKEGDIELRQSGVFTPIFVRAREAAVRPVPVLVSSEEER